MGNKTGGMDAMWAQQPGNSRYESVTCPLMAAILVPLAPNNKCLRRRLASRFERLGVEAPPQRLKAPGRLENIGLLVKITPPHIVKPRKSQSLS